MIWLGEWVSGSGSRRSGGCARGRGTGEACGAGLRTHGRLPPKVPKVMGRGDVRHGRQLRGGVPDLRPPRPTTRSLTDCIGFVDAKHRMEVPSGLLRGSFPAPPPRWSPAMAALDEPLSIRQLEVFVSLVDHGSFTRAARHLGLSQSTVSGHVADLERRLGSRVVERGRRQIRPTPAGEALLAPARETLKAERTTRMAVQELTGLLRGQLTLGGSTIPATYLLPGPRPVPRPASGDRAPPRHRRLARDPRAGARLGRGAGGRGREARGGGAGGTRIGQDRLVLIVPPDHAWRPRPSVPPREVAAAPLVLREEGSGTREATLAMLARAGAPVSPRGSRSCARSGAPRR